jgi:hypothetical protein
MKDPKERSTIDKLLNHEWLGDADDQLSEFIKTLE